MSDGEPHMKMSLKLAQEMTFPKIQHGLVPLLYGARDVAQLSQSIFWMPSKHQNAVAHPCSSGRVEKWFCCTHLKHTL